MDQDKKMFQHPNDSYHRRVYKPTLELYLYVFLTIALIAFMISEISRDRTDYSAKCIKKNGAVVRLHDGYHCIDKDLFIEI